MAHWFTMVSFGILFFTLLNAFGQLFDPEFALPVIGHFFLYEWVTDFFAFAGFLGILVLIAIRQKNHPRSAAGEDGRRSRFFGSTWWQAYYVEFDDPRRHHLHRPAARARVDARAQDRHRHGHRAALPADRVDRQLLHRARRSMRSRTSSSSSRRSRSSSRFAWMITIALQPTMGVAWHRFLAFFNIFFKRHADGRTSLGELQPIRVGGEVLDFENVDDLDEDAALGVGKVEDFTWKGLLDFTTCTECGRCQSQCPAWNTDKPLSPKLLVMALRDHAHAKSPWLLASEEVRAGGIEAADGFSDATKGAVATEQLVRRDRLRHPPTRSRPTTRTARRWGGRHRRGRALVVHDVRRVRRAVPGRHRARRRHRRHAPLQEPHRVGLPRRAQRPVQEPREELATRGGSPRACGWTGPRTCRFEVKQVGVDVEALDEVDYLFWVGCAGAYEDRAKKTTRAVAELLDTAGVELRGARRRRGLHR